MNPFRKFFVDEAPDLKRRGFIFGASALAASLIVPAPKSFFIVKAPKLIVARPDKPFDLPLEQMLALARKLDEQEIKLKDIPRWVVVDKQWYDALVARDV